MGRSSTASAFGSLPALQAELYRRANRSRPVGELVALLGSATNLLAAWEHVRSGEGSRTPGIDGVTAAVVERQGKNWLDELGRMLKAGYHPSPIRWVDVPKANKPGQTRRLGILTLRDRVVLTALKQILEPILDPLFLPTSFGFRPGRSVPAALGEAVRLLTEAAGSTSFTHAAHLDVVNCFDTIDHGLLLTGLREHVSDGDVLGLIDRFLAAGGGLAGWLWWRRSCGLVQGSAVAAAVQSRFASAGCRVEPGELDCAPLCRRSARTRSRGCRGGPRHSCGGRGAGTATPATEERGQAGRPASGVDWLGEMGFMLTEGERTKVEEDPLWSVAIVLRALEPSAQMVEVRGTELLAHWKLDPVTWRISPPIGPLPARRRP